MPETFFYLTTTGRVTGSPHQIEIWYVEHENCYYLCSEYPNKADWVKNIVKNPTVTYHLAQSKIETPEATFAGTARALEDNDSLNAAIKPLFDQKYNWSSGLIVQICPAT